MKVNNQVQNNEAPNNEKNSNEFVVVEEKDKNEPQQIQPSNPDKNNVNVPELSSGKNNNLIKEPNQFGNGKAEENGHNFGQSWSPWKVSQKEGTEYKQFSEAYDPFNPEQKLRKKGFPVGLQNVGNSKT